MDGAPSVVVVGGTSFVGSHLLPRLADAHAVAATYRTGPPPGMAGVQWVKSDLAEADPTRGWPSHCDSVVYLAQSRRWRSVPDGAADVFDVNIRAVFAAAEYARRAGASRFVFASSGSIYDATDDGPLRESALHDVRTRRQFYGVSKLAAELILNAYAAWMSIIILRLFVPYGRGQSDDMLMPQLLRKVTAGEALQLDGDQGLRLNPVAVGDAAETFARCLRLDETTTMNVAGPEVLTLRQIGEHIGRAVGREPRFEVRDVPARSLVADTSLLSDRLQWRPQRSFAAGLQEWLAAPAPSDAS